MANIITYNEIKECSYDLANVSEKKVCKAIPDAELWLKSCIGEKLFNRILEQKCTGFDECIAKIWDKLKIALVRKIESLLVFSLSVQLSNKGAVTLKGEYTQSASNKNLTLLKKQFEAQAETFVNAALEIVNNDSECFPKEKENCVEKEIGKKQNPKWFVGGVSKPKEKKCCKDGCGKTKKCCCKKEQKGDSKEICAGFYW